MAGVAALFLVRQTVDDLLGLQVIYQGVLWGLTLVKEKQDRAEEEVRL